MKVLVVSFYSTNTPHFETDLELAQTHLDNEDEVSFLVCDGSLQACDINYFHSGFTCLKCMKRRHAGIRALSGSVRMLPLQKLAPLDERRIVDACGKLESIGQWRDWNLENFDIGKAALSSVISARRDPAPDLKDKTTAKMLKEFALAAYTTYLSVAGYLDGSDFERVYLYNGRFAPMRGALRAAQRGGVSFFTHERGADLHRYALFENTLPHDISYWERSMQSAWDAADAQSREKIAHDFYVSRAAGKVQNWHSFVEGQDAAKLPPGWDPAKKNIAVFISSEDEFAAIGGMWENDVYVDQIDGVHKLVADLKDDPNIHLYIRVHPNLIGVDNYQTVALANLKGDNLTIVSADSPVSSYRLMTEAATVLTFGSTVGIEAAYWGKPSILAGAAYYKQTGSVYCAKTHAEVLALLRQDLPARDNAGAKMYGYYRATYGERFKYFEPTGISDGLFKADGLCLPKYLSIGSRLLRFADRVIPVSSAVGRLLSAKNRRGSRIKEGRS